MYSIYCSNQDTSIRAVEEAEKRLPKFRAWVKNNQTKLLSRGLDLQGFLVKPIQRICKCKHVHVRRQGLLLC